MGVEKKPFESPHFDVLDAIFGYAKPTIPLSDSHIPWKSKRRLYDWYRLADHDCQ